MGLEDLWGYSQYVISYLCCVLGIIFSVIIPIAVQALQEVKRAESTQGNFNIIWEVAKPYLRIGIASIIIGVVIYIFLADTLKDPRIAFIAGYTWDSTLQKAKGPKEARAAIFSWK